MFMLALTMSLAAIGVLCWLLFTLATFALPIFVGIGMGSLVYNTGAGAVGALAVGGLAAFVAVATGQILIGAVRPLWLKLTIASFYVGPAAIAGFHATHGVAKHLVPSPTCQTTFALAGAIAVGVTAYLRLAGPAAGWTSEQAHLTGC